MPDPLDAREFQARLQRLDALLLQVEGLPDPAARAFVREIAQTVLDLHGAGLERILHHLDATGGPALENSLEDPAVSGLLLLHGLHPLDVETRVGRALEQVRPYLQSHGGDVELLGIDDGIARLHLAGSCHGCPSSAMTMKQTIEDAILAHAPDVTAVLVDGDAAEPMTTPDGRQLVVLSGI